MKRFSFIAAVLLCFVTVASAAIRPAQPGIGGGGGTSGSVTGSYGFSSPLVLSGTSVSLPVPPTNRVMVMSSVASQMTNAFKRYYFDTNVAPSLSNLVAAAASGDVVELGAGDFRIGVQTIRVPVGVTLKGQGMGQTRIIGDVGVATNSIVQIMSTNIIEDLTIIANKPAYFQYPIGNNMIFGHPAATNAVIRRVQIFGETDCLLISQSNRVSVTLEQVDFRSAWDVCNLIDLDTGDGVPGVTATVIDSQLYSDSAQALNPQALLDPKSQPLIVSGAILDLINCIVTATNHKAITLSMQGFETNLVYVTDTIFRSAGTNGYGKQIDISTDSDVSVSKAIVSSQRIQDSDINGSTGVTYLPAQTGSLRVSTIRSLDDVFASDGLFGRTLTLTNDAQIGGTINTVDLNSTGSAVLKDAAVDSLTMALATASRVARIDANGNITNVVSGSPSTEYVKADGTTGTPSGSASTNLVTLEVGRLNVTNGISMTGPSGTAAEIQLFATNNTPVVLGVANSNSVPVTNFFGVLHKASASVIVLDCNHGSRFQVTNRLGQGTTFVVTNLAQGQEITIKGSADGTSRSVTVVPQLGFLVRDFDAFGVAAALNKAITATNGNTFEINISAAWEHGTNWADIVTRQATY